MGGRRWTQEERDFLISAYPICGLDETHRLFNERFAERTKHSIYHQVYYTLGLRMVPERKQALMDAIRRRKTAEVGFVNPKTGMIKTENGWVRLSKKIGVPKGKYAVHLDGDKTNNDADNIAIISPNISMKMTKNAFWSSEPEITKTGIMCCTLEDALSKSEARSKYEAFED